MYKVDQYAVFGNPISHSKSPMIHRLFAEQTNQRMNYTAILAHLNSFPAAAAEFARNGGKGFNITVPFKHQAWEISHKRSAYAQRAGAVNTIICRDDGTLFGDNTDGIGIVRDLQNNLRIQLRDKRILIAGAGGAVRGVIEPIAECKPGLITIANRTPGKAVELANEFTDIANIKGVGFDSIGNENFDIVINGTAASLKNEIPAIPTACIRNAICYDMMYAKKPTPFMQWALEHGAHNVFDGLGMLVEQAAEAFYLWRQIRPQTYPVIKAIRESLLIE